MRRSHEPSGVKCSTERCSRIITNAELTRSMMLHQKPFCKLCYHIEYYRRQGKRTLDVTGIQIDTLVDNRTLSNWILKGGEKHEY